MGRYSPTVLPDFGGEGFSEHLARAFERGFDRRRQRQLDTERTEDRARARESHDLAYYERGGRRGTPPPNPGHTVTFPGEPDIPESLDFTPRPPRHQLEQPTSALEPDSFDATFLRELEQGGRTGSPRAGSGQPPQSPLEEPVDFGADAPAGSRAVPASRHPGAFDPETRTFGGSAVQQSVAAASAASRRVPLGPTGRYTQIDDNHYIDERATPGAERAADRESQLALASALRQDEIGARGTAARELEQLRQQGRLALRDRINAAQITAILTRGDVQGKNQMAHDQRVTTRATAAGARPATGGQREANAMRAARGVVAAANGSFDNALDWIENTAEGQDAARNGLAARHLYAAYGELLEARTNRAASMQTGAMGYTPDESTGNLKRTRANIEQGTRRPRPPSGASSGSTAGTAGGARKSVTQAEHDALVKRGFTPEAIRQRYTVTP